MYVVNLFKDKRILIPSYSPSFAAYKSMNAQGFICVTRLTYNLPVVLDRTTKKSKANAELCPFVILCAHRSHCNLHISE